MATMHLITVIAMLKLAWAAAAVADHRDQDREPTPAAIDPPDRQEQMRAALSTWLNREIDDAQRAGDPDASQRLHRALRETQQKPAVHFDARRSDMVPHFPHLADNPYARAYLRAVEHFRMPNHRRGSAYYRSLTSQRIRRYAYELFPHVWAVCSPQSPHYRSAGRMKKVLASFEALLHLQTGGDYNAGRGSRDANMNRFTYALLNDAYRMLTSTYPKLLPAALREDWEQQIRLGAEHQVRTFSEGSSDHPHGAFWYPNIDAAYTHQMYLAGRILDHRPYITLAEARARRLRDIMQPDGAWPYLGLSNEEPAYHGVTLKWLIRYWQVSGNEDALEAIRQSAPYYPLSAEAGGVISGSPSPYWKQRWDAVQPDYPEAVAAIARDAMNKAVAADLLRRIGDSDRLHQQPLPIGASFYDPEIAPAELPDRFIVHDRNIDGPRGRFGRWSFTATGRDLSDDRGKYSFVGCMVTAEDDGMIYPLSGALKVAFFEYLPHDDPNLPIHLTADDACHTVVAERAAAFTAATMMQRPQAGGGRSHVKPWRQNQIWLMTEHRMVGYMELMPDGEQTAHGRAAVYRLGAGRGLPFVRGIPAGNVSQFQRGESAFQFGQLNMRILDHNFDRVTIQTPWQSRYRYRGTWIDVRLQDDDQGSRRLYAPGDRRFVLVELWPQWNDSAEQVAIRELGSGRYRLEVEADGQKITVTYDGQTNRAILQGAGRIKSQPTFPPS